ncbi:hypothetical protein OO013_20025 [Mangrovivirga sp. M17]|uniref:Uncharacterized protein n=1 Tax=Mangrovivirga halotolerans TaxID=2993936 RepID=A0ABT3RWM4_9BACT|nr:hypothetical protein [Mangrovivirga halotolerans]MCX2746177.1 hypothetical protein [Mangrovivirga halotolerans]
MKDDANLNKSVKPTFLLIQDSLISNPPVDFDNFNIEYVSEKECIKLLEKKNQNFQSYDFIYINKIANDTIDINIGGPSISVNKTFKVKNWRISTREVSYSISCGGTYGYIPSGRFIYNKNGDEWIYISSQEIIKDKREERNRIIESYRTK